jgi:hypothetical protein
MRGAKIHAGKPNSEVTMRLTLLMLFRVEVTLKLVVSQLLFGGFTSLILNSSKAYLSAHTDTGAFRFPLDTLGKCH